MQSDRWRSQLANDVPASIVVLLISLPLALGVAIASGAAPGLGLVTAVVGGVVVGSLGGAPIQISGPSTGLTVLVLQMAQEHGFAVFAVIVILAGLVQICAGMLKWGRYFQAVSPAVIRGMLTGIGLLLIASQVHVMLDREIPGTGLQNLLSIPGAVLHAIHERGAVRHDEAMLLGLITLGVVFAWDKTKRGPLRIVPGPLVGVLLASVVANALDLPISFVDLPERIIDLITLPTVEALHASLDVEVLLAGVGLAFVASAETLLCASALDRMHPYGKTNYDRALSSHGLGNVICGLLGALPLTGVISRSSANVEAGARTRWSAVLHGLGILGFVLFAPGLLGLVPTTALAAVLIYIGIKLVNPRAVRSMAKFGWPVISIFAVTVAGIVFMDLLKGIVAGLIVSAIRLMYQMSHVEIELERSPHPSGEPNDRERWDLHLRFSATFLGLPRLQEVLSRVEPGVELHVHFDDLEFIDHACLDLLNDFRAAHELKGGLVVVEWDELFSLQRKRRLTAELSSTTPRPGA